MLIPISFHPSLHNHSSGSDEVLCVMQTSCDIFSSLELNFMVCWVKSSVRAPGRLSDKCWSSSFYHWLTWDNPSTDEITLNSQKTGAVLSVHHAGSLARSLSSLLSWFCASSSYKTCSGLGPGSPKTCPRMTFLPSTAPAHLRPAGVPTGWGCVLSTPLLMPLNGVTVEDSHARGSAPDRLHPGQKSGYTACTWPYTAKLHLVQ